jgi:hypothetical protein
MTIHRFIPAHPHGKHGDKTACGIEIVCQDNGGGRDAGGALIQMTDRGQQFDCVRCRRVLEIRHG